jgi:hypothetical protein
MLDVHDRTQAMIPVMAHRIPIIHAGPDDEVLHEWVTGNPSRVAQPLHVLRSVFVDAAKEFNREVAVKVDP